MLHSSWTTVVKLNKEDICAYRKLYPKEKKKKSIPQNINIIKYLLIYKKITGRYISNCSTGVGMIKELSLSVLKMLILYFRYFFFW